MSTHTLAGELARLPHFQHLSPELLERVAAVSRPRTFQSGETVFLQGEPCRGFFAVRSGGVRIYRLSPDGREQTVHVLGPGRSFAEAALFRFGRYPVHATATVSPTELIEIGGQGFLELFESEPAIGRAMVASLCQRLVELVERVEELSVVHVGPRLARHLLSLPALSGTGPPEIELGSSKKDLAALLAIAPETLSRQLRTWRERGLIEG